jgi:hypothetical protein
VITFARILSLPHVRTCRTRVTHQTFYSGSVASLVPPIDRPLSPKARKNPMSLSSNSPFMHTCCGMERVTIWRTEVLILGRFRVTWGITIFNIQCVIPNLLLPSFKGCGMVDCSNREFCCLSPPKKIALHHQQ